MNLLGLLKPRLQTAARNAGSVLVVLATTSAAHAVNVATVSLGPVTYTLSGGSLSWIAASQYQTLYAQATDAGGLLGFDSRSADAANYLPASVTATTSTSTTTSQSIVGQGIRVSGSSAESVGLPFYLPNSATGNGATSGEFTLSQPGTVTFSVPYTLTIAGVAGNSTDNYANAAADFVLGNNSDPDAGGRLSAELFSFDQLLGAGSTSGVFTLSMSLATGNVGYYNVLGSAEAVATAAIPEPSTFALTLLGLVAVGRVVARRGKGLARGEA